MKKLSLILAMVMLLVLTAAVTYLITYQSAYRQAKADADSLKEEYSETYRRFAKFFEAVGLFDELFIREKEMDDEALNEWAIAGYLQGSGDKYADYYSVEALEELYADMNGESVGIGVLVTYNPDARAIQIINVTPDSPAMEAGVLPGDLIVAVRDGEADLPVASLGYDLALTHLRGEEGTTADFTVNRDGALQQFSIERRKVVAVNVEAHPYAKDPTIGVVSIFSFGTTLMVSQFADAVNGLLAKGCTRFVMDVRNNPGGLLTSIEAVLDMLLPEGPLVRTIDKNGVDQVIATSDKSSLNVPIAVLVNENSASASELFASALQDYARKGAADVVIVGTQTFGKGTMQTTQTLSDGSAIKVTYRYYCPPYSDNFDGVGVTPDIPAELTGDAAGKNPYILSDEEDTQMLAAVAALNK